MCVAWIGIASFCITVLVACFTHVIGLVSVVHYHKCIFL